MAVFQIFVPQKSAHGFCSKSFVSNLLRFLKLASKFSVRVLVRKGFIRQSLLFLACALFGQARFSKLASRFLAKVSASLVRAFLLGLFFLAK